MSDTDFDSAYIVIGKAQSIVAAYHRQRLAGHYQTADVALRELRRLIVDLRERFPYHKARLDEARMNVDTISVKFREYARATSCPLKEELQGLMVVTSQRLSAVMPEAALTDDERRKFTGDIEDSLLALQAEIGRVEAASGDVQKVNDQWTAVENAFCSSNTADVPVAIAKTLMALVVDIHAKSEVRAQEG